MESGAGIPTDAGTQLLFDMVRSENTYEYSVSNKNNGKPLNSGNGTINNFKKCCTFWWYYTI